LRVQDRRSPTGRDQQHRRDDRDGGPYSPRRPLHDAPFPRSGVAVGYRIAVGIAGFRAAARRTAVVWAEHPQAARRGANLLTEIPMATRLRFVRRQHEAENATTFYFEPDSPLAYTAGQYLNYTLPHPNPDNRGTRRSFTLSSFPEEPLLSLTTRLSTPRSS